MSNKITVVRLSVRPSVWHFSQELLISFLIFGIVVDNWNILKAISPFFFPENLFLPKLWAKMMSGNHIA